MLYCAVLQIWTGDMYFPRTGADQENMDRFYEPTLPNFMAEPFDSPPIERLAKPVSQIVSRADVCCFCCLFFAVCPCWLIDGC